MVGVRKLADMMQVEPEDIALSDEEAMIAEAASSDEETLGLQMHPVPELMSVKSNYGLVAVQQRWRWRCLGFLATAAVMVLVLMAPVPWRRAGSGGASVSAIVSSDNYVPARKYVTVVAQEEPWPNLAGHTGQSVPWPSSCVYGETPECPANALFLNPEVLSVATNNLMHIGHGELLAEGDKDLVLDMVTSGFANISRQLGEHAPEVAEKLAATSVSEAQLDKVLRAMRLLTNWHVQRLGADVVQAVRRSESSGTDEVVLDVMAMLHFRLSELQGLARELLLDAPATFWASEQELRGALDAERIRAIQGVKGPESASSAAPSSVIQLSTRLRREHKASAILGGVAEEGCELVEIMQLYTGFLGTKVHLPAKAIALSEASDLSACSMHGDVHFAKSASTATLFCPLRLARLGLEALHAVLGAGISAVA
mmetsp:Transcript_46674/g.117426  ORF Transcript_46674/g.117426 Transcript_46674/m.117426 type:complete len:427 (+) Transcript_46674:78-1358(+)